MNNSIVIKKIKSGNNNELEEVYKKYRNDFLQWIISTYNCSIDDAKDLYQQVIIIFYENIINDKLTELRSSIKTYLFAIGRNKMYQQSRFSKIATSIKNTEFIEDTNINTENEEEMNLFFKITETSLKQLGNPCKNLLELFYYHKKTTKEIIRIMGYKNTDTVKNQKYKCLQRLKGIFDSQLTKNKDLSYGYGSK